MGNLPVRMLFGGHWRVLRALFLKLHKGASQSGSAHANPKQVPAERRWCDAREIQMSPFSGKFVFSKKSAPWEWVAIRKLVTMFTQTNEYLRTLEARRRDPDRSVGWQMARILAG